MNSGQFVRSRRLNTRHRTGQVFQVVALGATLFGLIVLAVLLFTVASDGLGRVSWEFLNSFASRFPEQTGIKAALYGTGWMMLFTAVIAVPLGIGAATYLEEFAPRNWVTKVIETNINNLAGVPSIIYGLLGLAVFVRLMDLGRVILAGSLTMSLLVLPIIIVASREGLRAVPPSIREASLGLGATQWQTVWYQVLPPAMPSILTGVIFALSRAIGETAPLIMIGALTTILFLPSGPFDQFTVLPIQIFNWVSRPQAGFQEAAAAGIVVLLTVLMMMNMTVILLRNHFEGKRRW
ncbi:MAG: phosphate ABC transporter permease PstA [Chloroflexi bacterium]|nr:phosphate ABC transporter permease PstA [Chloroflexota bacterium]MDA1240772.1 phosphate ABC transporter permease PstA [Chloroflexota bacterium]